MTPPQTTRMTTSSSDSDKEPALMNNATTPFPTVQPVDASDYPAIDFRALLRQEKRLARQRRQEERSRQAKEQAISSIVFGKKEKQEETCGADAAPDERSVNTDDWPEIASFPRLDRVRHRLSAPLRADEKDAAPPLDSVYYIPQCMNQAHQERLLQWLQRLPENSSTDAPQKRFNRWTTMTYGKRRVCLFESGSSDDNHDDSSLGLLPLPLQQIANGLVRSGIFPETRTPNSVLINEYQSGQGILPHTDGPLYDDTTATISMGGSPVLLDFTKRLATHEIGSTEPSNLALQVLLHGTGSLLVFGGDAYTHYCHSILQDCDLEYASDKCANAPVNTLVERGYRISLTFRHKKEFHRIA